MNVSPAVMEQLWDLNQRVMPLGHRDVGSDTSKVRFLASPATEYVRVHVQHDGGGAGGPDYDADDFDAQSARVDCRVNRLQEVEVARDGVNHFWVWLIPEFKMGADYIRFDGVEREDFMACADLGV